MREKNQRLNRGDVNKTLQSKVHLQSLFVFMAKHLKAKCWIPVHTFSFSGITCCLDYRIQLVKMKWPLPPPTHTHTNPTNEWGLVADIMGELIYCHTGRRWFQPTERFHCCWQTQALRLQVDTALISYHSGLSSEGGLVKTRLLRKPTVLSCNPVHVSFLSLTIIRWYLVWSHFKIIARSPYLYFENK